MNNYNEETTYTEPKRISLILGDTKGVVLPENKINSERAMLINDFLVEINKEREGTTYKPMTARGVAIKLGHIPTNELYYFYKVCFKSKSFGRTFFGALKIK